MRECESRSSGFRGLNDHKSRFTTGDKRISIRTEQRATNSYFNAEGIGASDAMIRPVILLDQQVWAKYPAFTNIKMFRESVSSRMSGGGGGWSII